VQDLYAAVRFNTANCKGQKQKRVYTQFFVFYFFFVCCSFKIKCKCKQQLASIEAVGERPASQDSPAAPTLLLELMMAAGLRLLLGSWVCVFYVESSGNSIDLLWLCIWLNTGRGAWRVIIMDG